MVSVRSAMDARKRMSSGSSTGASGSKLTPGAPTAAQMVSSPSTPPVKSNIHNSSSNSGGSNSIRHVRSVSTLAPLSKVKLLLEKGHDNINKLSKFDVEHCCDPEFTQLVTSRASEFMPRCDLRKLPLFWVQACSVEYFNKLAVDYAAIRDEWLSMDRRGKEAARMYAGARSAASGAAATTRNITPPTAAAAATTPATPEPASASPADQEGNPSEEMPPRDNNANQPPINLEMKIEEPESEGIVAEDALKKADSREHVAEEMQQADDNTQMESNTGQDADVLSDKAAADEDRVVDEDRTAEAEEFAEDKAGDKAEAAETSLKSGHEEQLDDTEEHLQQDDNDSPEQLLASTPDNRPSKSLGVRDLSRLAPLCDVRPLLFANNPWCRKFDIKYCSDPQFAETLARCAETYLGPECDLGKLPAYIVQACYVEHFMSRTVDFAALRDDWLFHRGGKAGRERLEEEAAAGYIERRPARQQDSSSGRAFTSADRHLIKREKSLIPAVEKEDFNSDDGFQPRKRRRRSKRQVEDLNITPADSPPQFEEPERAAETKSQDLEAKYRDSQARCLELEARYQHAEARCRELEAKYQEARGTESRRVASENTGVEPMDQEVEPLHNLDTDIEKRCEEAVARYKVVAYADCKAKCQEVDNRCKKIADARCREVEGKCKREAKETLGRYKKEFESRMARYKREADEIYKQVHAKLKETEAKLVEESRSPANRLLKALKRVEVLPTDHAPEELRGEPLAMEVFDKEARSQVCPMCSQRFTSEGWYTLGTCGHQYHLQCLLLHAFCFCSCAVCKTGLPCEFYRTIGHESFVE